MEKKEFITHSSLETEELSCKFAKQLKAGDVLCLFGELGSGKTTFVKGLAKGLGITSRIISPTFVVVRAHKLKTVNSKHKTKIETLYHLDLYRLETQEAVENIGLKEILEDKEAVVLIEWAEKAKDLLPEKRFDIVFEYIEDDNRKIIITSHP